MINRARGLLHSLFYKLKISGNLEANSVDTGSSQIDDFIKDEDYFNAANYPTITFSTTKILKSTLYAEISIKKITQNIAFDVKDVEIDEHKVTISISGTIDRNDFRMDNTLSSVISDNVIVKAKIVGTR